MSKDEYLYTEQGRMSLLTDEKGWIFLLISKDGYFYSISKNGYLYTELGRIPLLMTEDLYLYY